MAKSTKKPSFQKAKPYPEFPLSAHPSGRWCKKFRGKQYYFGPVDDWESALDRYKREWPYILDGTGQPSSDEFLAENGFTLVQLCNDLHSIFNRETISSSLIYPPKSPSSSRRFHTFQPRVHRSSMNAKITGRKK